MKANIRRLTQDEVQLRTERDEQLKRLAAAHQTEQASSLPMLRGAADAADQHAQALDDQRDAKSKLHRVELALAELMREQPADQPLERMTVAQATEELAAVDQALVRVSQDEGRIQQELEHNRGCLVAYEVVEKTNVLPAHRGDAAAQSRLDAAVAEHRDAEAAIRLRTFALDELSKECANLEQRREALTTAKYEAERNDLAQHRLRLATELDADCARVAQKMIEWRELNIQISGLTTKIDGTVDTRLHYVWPRVFSHHFATVNHPGFVGVPLV